MARRGGLFRRKRSGGSRRRSVRRNRRGVGGIGGRILKLVTTRPLKVVSGVLGVSAVASIFVEPDPNGYSVATDVIAAAQGNVDALQNIPYHLQVGVSSGAWIAPAAGSIITGIISRVFKV